MAVPACTYPQQKRALAGVPGPVLCLDLLTCHKGYFLVTCQCLAGDLTKRTRRDVPMLCLHLLLDLFSCLDLIFK